MASFMRQSTAFHTIFKIVGRAGLEPAKKPAFKPDPAPCHRALLYLLIASTTPFELVAPVGIAPT